MANDFKKQLAASKKTWKAARKRVVEERGKSGAPEFEDGIYLARLSSYEIGEWNGNLKVLFKWKFMDGDYNGQLVYDYQGITSEDNLFYFGRRLEDFGYEMPDDPTEIPDILDSIIAEKKMCKIRLKTGGAGYQNVFVNKVLGDDEEAEDDDAEEQEDDTPEEKPAKGKKAKKEEPAEEEADEEEADEEEADEEEADEEEADEEEADEDETEDGDVELSVGMKVVATTSKGERKGEVIEILEKEGLVRVKTEDGKVVKVSVEKIVFDEAPADDEEEDDEEEAPEPPKKVAKKTAPVKTGKKR